MFTKLRPYRVEDVVESSFLSSDSKKNQEFCVEDLVRSGLDPDDMMVAAPENLKLPSFALAGYHIPYWDLDGRVITRAGSNYNTMWRTRYKLPEFSKDARYLQPTKERLASFGLPSFLPYLLPYPKEYDDEPFFYIVEGEKKTASVIRHFQVPALGICGCKMWGNPSGTGGIHPWIVEYLKSHRAAKIRIIPDADVLRYDMCQTYGTFADALTRAGYEVELLHPTDKIDDIIVRLREGDKFRRDYLEGVERIKSSELVQTPASLAKHFNLAFRASDKGVITVHQHTSNVMKLMEEHHAFPKFWRNLDTNRVMVGEELATPDLTEMEIANHFQHNFGFDKVNSRIVYQCIQAISKKNQRSPFLDTIKGLTWDGTARLGSWLQRLWGVEDSDYVREVGIKWLVSSCARMDKPGSKVDWMLIVIGPQGTGKTSLPGLIYKGNSLTLYGEQNDKDLHMLLHSALVVGFDELDSFNRKEASTLKAMITRNEDAFRPPYGASVEVFPRRFTLYGCGNRHEFLQHDPSGYRRYAVIGVHQLLDFKGLETERSQLWAEAWHRYQHDGLNWWEIGEASREAEGYVVPNLLEEQIGNWIIMQIRSKQSTMVKDGVLQFTMSQLLAGIGENNSKNAGLTREVAAILRGMGAEQKMARVGRITARLYSLPITSQP